MTKTTETSSTADNLVHHRFFPILNNMEHDKDLFAVGLSIFITTWNKLKNFLLQWDPWALCLRGGISL